MQHILRPNAKLHKPRPIQPQRVAHTRHLRRGRLHPQDSRRRVARCNLEHKETEHGDPDHHQHDLHNAQKNIASHTVSSTIKGRVSLGNPVSNPSHQTRRAVTG